MRNAAGGAEGGGTERRRSWEGTSPHNRIRGSSQAREDCRTARFHIAEASQICRDPAIWRRQDEAVQSYREGAFMTFGKMLLAAAATMACAGMAQAEPVQIEFWHGLTQPLGGMLEQIAADFNASQSQYKINASFKGGYPEVMTAAIAAFRAGNAPDIVQMFEVGTATMMAARGAVKPVYELMQESGLPFDPNNYIAAVRGYYSTPDGKMLSMPFNTSTPIMFYNKDLFQKAGLDPAKPPLTWPETIEATKKLKAAGVACPLTTAWPTWIQIENFGAIHNVPLATKVNGMAGMDAVLEFNSALHVKHIQNLIDMAKEGLFKYGGRDAAADALFPSGE